jgi:hypothetical protein
MLREMPDWLLDYWSAFYLLKPSGNQDVLLARIAQRIFNVTRAEDADPIPLSAFIPIPMTAQERKQVAMIEQLGKAKRRLAKDKSNANR